MNNTNTRQILFISAGIAGIAIMILFIYFFLNKSKIQSNHSDSLVLITDKTGYEHYGTGFFIEGEPGKCTVVTSEEVIKSRNINLKLTANVDGEEYKLDRTKFSIIKFSSYGYDESKSALIIFTPKNSDSDVEQNCPYKPLKLSSFNNSSSDLSQGELTILGFNTQENSSFLDIKLISYFGRPGENKNSTYVYQGDGVSPDQIQERIGGMILYNREQIIAINHAILGDNTDKEFILFPNEEFLLQPQTYQNWLERARNLSNKSVDQDEIIANLDIAIEINNEGIEAWEEKAKILEEQCKKEKSYKKCESALDALQKVTEINQLPKSSRETELLKNWYRRCDLLLQRDKFEKAIETCEKYVSFDSDISKIVNQAKEEYNKLEISRLEEELETTKEELETTKEELETTKEELEITKEELENTKEELEITKAALEEKEDDFQDN